MLRIQIVGGYRHAGTIIATKCHTAEKRGMIKRHQKSRSANQPGQIVEREASIDISNVMLVCPECAATVRTGHKTLDNGSKVRICKKCQATIETPKK